VADQPRRRLKRGAAVVLAILVVAAVAVGAVLFVRSRQVTRSVEGLCTQLGAAQDLDQALTTLDPTTLEPQVQALSRAKAVAPDDIKASVVTLADFVASVTDTVSTADGDREQALVDALAARQTDVDAATAAGTAVQQWAQVNCGLSLAGTGSSTTATTGAPAGTTP
jgi:predicted PurR-regulated permease PerM